MDRLGVAIDAEVMGMGVDEPMPIPANPTMAGSQPARESAKWSNKNLEISTAVGVTRKRH